MTPRPLALPEPATTDLGNAPLELVVCQVQHDRALSVASPARALEFRDALTDVFDEKLIIEDNAQQEIAFQAGGPPGISFPMQSDNTKGWRLRTRDSSWVAVLMPDFFALESTGYTTWSGFRKRLEALTRIALSRDEPTIEKRLGLRYVDRLTQPVVHHVQDWKGYIDDFLLGPIASPGLGPSVIGSQQVVQFLAEDQVEVLLRHGPQRTPQGLWQYTLDTDCYRANSERLSPKSVLSGADQLHKVALQVFQASITAEYLKDL